MQLYFNQSLWNALKENTIGGRGLSGTGRKLALVTIDDARTALRHRQLLIDDFVKNPTSLVLLYVSMYARVFSFASENRCQEKFKGGTRAFRYR